MLQATVQSYFAINDAQDTIAEKQAQNIVANRYTSYGTFHTFVKPTMRYGVIFGGSFKGMQMDIDQIMYQAVSKDNSTEELKGFILSQGPRESANEHLVPEQLFDDPKTAEKEVEGVSAVKALQIAQQQGQTIYTITKENYSQILPKLNLSSSVITDIRNAVNAGRIVTTHERNISVKGWTGSGYIILDPKYGTGAYLIDGGANGGFLDFMGSNANSFALVLGIASILATLGPVGAPIMIALIAVSVFVAAMVTLATNLTLIENNCPDTAIIMNSILNFVGFTLGTILKGTGTAILTAVSSWLYNNFLPSAAPLCKYR